MKTPSAFLVLRQRWVVPKTSSTPGCSQSTSSNRTLPFSCLHPFLLMKTQALHFCSEQYPCEAPAFWTPSAVWLEWHKMWSMWGRCWGTIFQLPGLPEHSWDWGSSTWTWGGLAWHRSPPLEKGTWGAVSGKPQSMFPHSWVLPQRSNPAAWPQQKLSMTTVFIFFLSSTDYAG